MNKLKNNELDKNKINDELTIANSEITKIYNMVMDEELLSYAKALRLSNDTTEIMTVVNNIIDKVDDYYNDLLSNTKKITVIMCICAIISVILMFFSTSLAFGVSIIGLYFAREARELREKLLDKSFKSNVKKLSLDITNISLNIVTFTKKKVDAYSKLPKIERLKLLKYDADMYLTEEEKELYNFDFSELEQSEVVTLNVDTNSQEIFEVPVQEVEMKLTRVPKNQKTNKNQ